MKRPLIRILHKVITNGFYREHTGFLLFLFVFIFINFFYTNVLNQTHLTSEEITRTALRLAIATVSEPLGVIALFGIFFIYSVKSWQYVAKRLKEVDVQFLFYSSNALSWRQQIQSWSVTQLSIATPIIILGAYAMIVGFAFGYWIVPLSIPIYLVFLIVCSASYYAGLVNSTAVKSSKLNSLIWAKSWPKPLFSLFLYEILANKRMVYVITKLTSIFIITLFVAVFSNAPSGARLFGMIALCVALSHVVLLYNLNEFELSYLRFARNLPYNQWQIYYQQIFLYSLLLLPELIFFLVSGDFMAGLIGVYLTISTILVFRSLLYLIGPRMDHYLRLVFGLFICFLLINLFELTMFLAVGNAVAAWMLLRRYQYQSLA